ncbi:probable proline--tRNA ligase, mitochondrial isoform X2 [Artemia franciscana]|uniref:Probable proline--tRNA ligase, mitochondrial n=1 Tax=Artemia franciscana TaxID=6661 RepID=A0AA88IA63_ARTSF|nr:hypothetical protein QYM36_000976 [Artemia franciscana]
MSPTFRLKNYFKPCLQSIPETSTVLHCKSSKLLLENGLVSPTGNGLYSFLPMGFRAVEKICKIIDNELEAIGALKLELPALTSIDLWKKTGRYDANNNELFVLKDRKERKYVLGPTHEETITNLVASSAPHPVRSLPIMLYQITAKYRDEPRPRYGLIRGREFIMKDLYTFDKSIEDAKVTYEKVSEGYDKIFRRLGLQFLKVEGPTGNMGGTVSHEYHYPSPIGDDRLLLCRACNTGVNVELDRPSQCSSCNGRLTETHGIEIGHTFLLGSKYSSALNATFINANGKTQPLEMGCYGIGVSRIVAAAVELLSSERQIRWPLEIAPFKVCIIPPKIGSKEEAATSFVDDIEKRLSKSKEYNGDILIDDRTNLTIGKRFMEAKKTGYPFIVIVGKNALDQTPKFELENLVKQTNEQLTFDQLMTHLDA